MIEGRYFYAMLLGAGSSRRMGFDKITALIGDKPVFVRSTEAFLESAADEIIVVVSEENYAAVSETLAQLETDKKLTVTVGGKDRIDSALKNIGMLTRENAIVAIHDCARPLVTPELIDRTARSAVQYGAAIPVVPVKDTVKRCVNGKVESTPPREELFLAQTPQIFAADIYRKAIQQAAESDKVFTDDSSMVEYYGQTVHITQGEYSNIKLTTPEDIRFLQRAAPLF